MSQTPFNPGPKKNGFQAPNGGIPFGSPSGKPPVFPPPNGGSFGLPSGHSSSFPGGGSSGFPGAHSPNSSSGNGFFPPPSGPDFGHPNGSQSHGGPGFTPGGSLPSGGGRGKRPSAGPIIAAALIAAVLLVALVRFMSSGSSAPTEGDIQTSVVPQADGTYLVTLSYSFSGLDPAMAYVSGFIMGPEGQPMILCSSPQIVSNLTSTTVQSNVIINVPGRYNIAFYSYPLVDPDPTLSPTQLLIVSSGEDHVPQPDPQIDWLIEVTPSPSPSPAPTATPSPTPTPAPTQATATPFASPTPTPQLRPTSDVFDIYPESMRYFYQQLTPSQKCAFSELYDGIATATTNITLTPCTEADFNRAMEAIRLDCPELFLIVETSGCHYYLTPYGLVNEMSYKKGYRMSASTFRSQLNQILGIIDGLSSHPDFGPSDYSKELVIYQYILDHCYYDLNDPNCANADSVWLYGFAKCSGYGRALSLALRRYGIPCLDITGKTYDNGVVAPTGHLWSIVKIDDQWYQCDATWDDPVDNNYNTSISSIDYMPYFNIDDRTMLSARSTDPVDFTYPSCNSLDENYYVRNGCFVPAGSDVESAVSTAFQNAVNRGSSELALFFESSSDFNTLLLKQKQIRDFPNFPEYISWSYSIGSGTQLYYVTDIH